MHLTRARYVTICQQFLVTAVVLAVGLSAAGVMTLQIVAPERPTRAAGLAPAIKVSDAYVDTTPVTPKVREVKVEGVDAAAAREIPGAVTAAPKTAAPSAPKTPDKLVALSAPTAVHGYATVGVTWDPGAHLQDGQISVQVRTEKQGAWSDWAEVKFEAEEGPADDGSEGDLVRPGTDPLIIGDVDQVQMRAETVDGTAPAGLQLAVIDPGADKLAKQPAAIDTAKLSGGDAPAAAPSASSSESPSETSSGDTVSLAAMTVTPRPTIYSRAQWGANEALRDKSSLRYGTIQTGFIHHTVNANNYTADQVPALIRGIYAYHTQSRGWSDIGYNFLVDRFGRIWEGRYGGVDRPVVGAHTKGYNEYSFAMSAIGNFDTVQPPQVMLDAYASLFAWKLSLSDIRADASHLWVKDRYLYAINGHRDVGSTACPGRYLYAKIPSVRVAAQAIEDNAQTPVDPVNLPVIPAPDNVPSPTQAPAPAVAQPPTGIPARSSSVAGSAWPDFLVQQPGTGTIQVVPTEGILDYTTQVVTGVHWTKMSAVAAVGDVTGDGRSDVLAKTKRTGLVRVFPGDGQGHVGAAVARTKAFAKVTGIVGVRDFNRDHHNDVIGRSRKTGALLLFPGAGHGTFKSPVTLRKKWGFSHTAGVGDLNGDHRPDLVGAKGNRVYLLRGGAHGTALAKPVLLTTTAAPVTGLYGWGDLDGDGRSDVMVRAGGVTTVYAGTGTPRLGPAYGPLNGFAGLGSASLAPMAGSTAADLVGRDAAGQLVVVVNNGARNLSAPLPSNLSLTAAGIVQLLNVGDWDRDGYSDVIVRKSHGDRLLLYPGLGDGRFGRPRSLGDGWQSITSLAAVGDVTGDGFPDLLGRTATGPMTIFPGAGVQAFTAPVLAPAALQTFNQIGSAPWPTTGPVLASDDGGFVPLSGTDPDTALRTANGTVPSTYDTYVGLGDVNGDGVADLLARERGTGTIWLLPGKTSGGFAPRMWVADGFAGYRLVG